MTEITTLRLDGPVFMSPAQAADAMGFDTEVVDELVATGDLKTVDVAGRPFVSAVAIADFLSGLD